MQQWEQQANQTDATYVYVPAPLEPESVRAPAPPAPIPFEHTQEMLRLLRGLRRKPLFSKIAADPYGNGWLNRESFAHLINLLRKPDDNRWRERAVACWAFSLANIEADEDKATVASTLCAIIDRSAAQRIRGSEGGARGNFWTRAKNAILRTAAVGFGMSTMVAAAVLAWRFAEDGAFPLWLTTFWFGLGVFFSFMLAMPVMPISVGIDIARTNRARTAAAWALGRVPRFDSAGSLAAASVDSTNARLRTASTASLRLVLPLLTYEHYGRLAPEAVPNLCRALHFDGGNFFNQSPETVALGMQLLEALEKVGDGRAVWYVEMVSKRSRNPYIADTARRLLPLLEERRRREQNAGMLLRGSSRPGAGADQLLRAAVGVDSNIPPDQLLRPTSPTPDAMPDGFAAEDSAT